MKRFFLLLICTLSCVCSFAKGSYMSIKSGSLDIFKEAVNINVAIDDYNAIIDGRNQPAKDYYTAQSQLAYTEFCTDLMRGHESFISYFNTEKGSIKSTVDISEDSPYTLQINVSSINVGNSGAAIIGLSHKAGGAVINGEMKLIEKATNKVLCEIEFSEIKGMRSPIFKGRVISVYRYLADALLNTIRLDIFLTPKNN